MAKEILDIVDDNGQPTGEVIDRVTAHREGMPEKREEDGLPARFTP